MCIGDGDCSSYNSNIHMNENAGPYGEDHKVIKEECVNHVHKRMGTALRKLVRDTTTEYQTKGGEVKQRKLLAGRGKLTENVINKLTKYYGGAIRRNVGKSVDEMSKDIWATFYHCSSTDERHRHFYCPEGTTSWCFWQRALAEHKQQEEEKKKKQEEREEELGETSAAASAFYPKKNQVREKSAQMPSHKHMTIQFVVGGEEDKKIKAVYERPTDPDLLKRCLQGKTQNPNESLHNSVWKYCPKVVNLGKSTLDFAIAQAVLNYNVGYEAGSLGRDLGIESPRMQKVLQTRDKYREETKPTKPRRKRKKQEVDPHYGAGEHI